MDPPVAAPTVEDDVPQLPFEFALRLQELHPQALRCPDESGVVLRIDSMRFLNEAVSVPRPLRDGADGSLEDLALLLSPHAQVG
jgi:hypothetical protein